jgi:hypothetical protein
VAMNADLNKNPVYCVKQHNNLRVLISHNVSIFQALSSVSTLVFLLFVTKWTYDTYFFKSCIHMTLSKLIPVGISERTSKWILSKFSFLWRIQVQKQLECIPHSQNNENRTQDKKIWPSFHMLPPCSLHLLTAQFVIILWHVT